MGTMNSDVRKRKRAKPAELPASEQLAVTRDGSRAEETADPGSEPEEAVYQLKALKRRAGS